MLTADKNKSFGHYLRRVIHLSLVIIPILYYWYGDNVEALTHVKKNNLLFELALFFLVTEVLRLWKGWIVIGQREYEKNRISAFAWGTIGTVIVLLVAPQLGVAGAAIGAPLIWSLALVDPLMGEMRRFHFSNFLVAVSGITLVSIIWGACVAWLGTPCWLLPIVIPLTITSEWFKVPCVDDNFIMLVLPLLACIFTVRFI
jgi:hypothetical protein